MLDVVVRVVVVASCCGGFVLVVAGWLITFVDCVLVCYGLAIGVWCCCRFAVVGFVCGLRSCVCVNSVVMFHSFVINNLLWVGL